MVNNVIMKKASQIKCLICDLDGVMTSGLLYIDNHHNELKAFHVHDGLGLKLLLASGIQVAIITGSKNTVVDHRMKELGIQYFFKNQQNKLNAFSQLQTTLHLRPEDFAYIGDDLPDIPLMTQVGLSVAVANAVDDVKKIATFETKASGGNGAVREVCDLILKAQNKYTSAIQPYFSDANQIVEPVSS